MVNTRKWAEIVALSAVMALPTLATAQNAPAAPVTPKVGQQSATLDKVSKAEAIAALDAKRKEARELTKQASEVALALTGAQDGDVQQLRTQLKEILEKLGKIDEELDAIKGWIEGQNEALPIMTNDILELKKIKISGYSQFQYADTNRQGGRTDSFQVRRARMTIAPTIDTRTSAKFSFDLAASNFGSTINSPNETTAQMRDAYLQYDIVPSDVKVGIQLRAGQMNVPLGYEIDRSSSDREFPERAQYNLVNFPGERTRGATLTYGIDAKSSLQVGVVNPMSVNDSEQRSFSGSRGNKLATSVAYRHYTQQFEFGVSAMEGDRGGYQVGWTGPTPPTGVTANSKVFAPDVARRFVYLDAAYIGLLVPQLFVRGEAMMGQDRNTIGIAESSASSGAAAGISNPNDAKLGKRSMRGYHTVLGYNLSARNQVLLKYEQYDPNTSVNGDLFEGYGAAYRYYINPGASVTLSHEIFEDQTRAANASLPGNKRYHVTTLRMQFKF